MCCSLEMVGYTFLACMHIYGPLFGCIPNALKTYLVVRQVASYVAATRHTFSNTLLSLLMGKDICVLQLVTEIML